MRARCGGSEGSCSEFNTAALAEVMFYSADWVDTVFIKDVEVEVDGAWKSLRQAFKDKDAVPNNANTSFAPPVDEEARRRGYNW